MANIIQIKRRSGISGAPTLAEGELGFDTSKNALYIGKSGANVLVALPTTGGTITGQIQKAGVSAGWRTGRDKAIIRNTTSAIASDAYNPVVSIKTYEGTWEIGGYTNNSLQFSYVTDANYNNNVNERTYHMYINGNNGKVFASAGFQGNGASLNSLNADNISTGTLPIARGGTGQTTVANAINNLIQNGCTVGNSDPVDGDTYLASYADGKNTAGTGTNTFHRRPVEKLWNYIAGKADSRYLKLSGGSLSGWVWHSAEVGDIYDTERYRSDGGGWAYTPIRFRSSNTGSYFCWIGVHGSNASFSHMFIGPSGTYDSTSNIRITNSGKLWANGIQTYGAASIYAGDGSTGEADIGASGKAGNIYMYSASSTTGNRGIYLSGNRASKYVMYNDSNNENHFYGLIDQIYYGSSEPTARTGQVWLKPIS